MPPTLAALPAGAAGAAPLLEDDPRRLAPPTASAARSPQTPGAALAERLSIPWDRGALTSTATALGIVVGLLLATSWLLKRGQPRAPGQLPPEAFCVLGRAMLPDRTPVQLLRLGSKLVLVANHQDQVRPLAEITDPLEVERLAGICQQSRQVGPAAEFQQVLQQLSREPARGFLGSEGLRG
jgi:flagellar biogenesis protein FliO